jgi:nicotinamide riboside transporter PnuC
MIPETTAESASALAWLLALTLGLGGLLVPGWLLTRCLPSAAPAVSAFLGSALILFHGILLLDGFGVTINVVSVALWLLATSAALVGIRRRWAPIPPPSGPPPAVAPMVPRGAVKWLPAIAIGFGALLLRGLLDPLSGWDTYFRWDRLARLLLETGSLDAYPAVTAADFALYPWPEGIPPLLPALHFWIYAVSGGPAAELTLGAVALVTTLLFTLTARFSRERWQSAEAGWVSVALLATSALAGWSLAMGQETGLTALTLVAMLYFLHRYREQRRTADAVWAGLAAATGALSRDYCLVYLLVGAATLLGRQDRGHGLRLFLGSAVAAIAPWYLRNAWITGNPLYSHDLAGLFPVSEVFVIRRFFRAGRFRA